MAYRSKGWRLALLGIALASAQACDDGETLRDAEAITRVDASADQSPTTTVVDASEDARTPDAAPPPTPIDAGMDADASPPAPLAEASLDATIDSSAADAANLDAAQTDAASMDATVADAGNALDGGGTDADAGTGPSDAQSDAAPTDARASIPDAGPSPKQLVAGRAHACSLDPAIDGVLCWGDNQRGQATVPTLRGPRFVAAGGDVTCAIESDDRVRCWGDASRQQLAVPALLGAVDQVAVGGTHVCALTRAGRIQCWGQDDARQLQAPTLSGVRALSAGEKHACALASEGVRCWGDNTQQQLDVPNLSDVTQIAAGAFHTCAIQRGGVACWGGSEPAPRTAPAISEARAIAAGRSHTCVIDRVGLTCWGAPGARSLTPRELTWPRQVAVGGGGAEAFACARHQQGVTCWGDDGRAQTHYDGAPLHMLYRGESEIGVPPARVWQVLMDLPNYGAWNPYTIAMQSSLKVGDPMVMTVKMNDLITLTQTENIRVLDPGELRQPGAGAPKACWGIDTTTPEQNSGERCQWLEPLPDGGTRYVTEDLIEGTLNPLVNLLFDNDVRTGFEGVARALKSYCEAHPTP